MGTVLPFAEHEPFDPVIAETMGVAFNPAWQALMVCGGELVASLRAEDTREELAMSIIGMAQLGECDVVRPRDDGIADVRHPTDATVGTAGGQLRRAGGWELGGSHV
jgi:hypothetical protein